MENVSSSLIGQTDRVIPISPLWKFNFGRIFTPSWRSPRPASCGERAKWWQRTRTTLTRRAKMGEQIRGQSNFYKIFMKKYLCEQECIYILIFEIQMKYKDCFFYWISNLQANGFFRSFRLRERVLTLTSWVNKQQYHQDLPRFVFQGLG